MSAKFIDLTGNRYGRLTVVKLFTPRCATALATWLCKCDCGTSVVKPSNNFKYHLNASCGCYKREFISALFRKYKKEDYATYNSWRAMIHRCTNKVTTKSRVYRDYQKRNIKVCKRWLKFENFIADMGPRPKGKTIERKNNDGNYSPSNCTWATPRQQAQNRRVRRDCRYLTHNGQTKPIAEWADIVGLQKGTINARMNYGWTATKILTTPLVNRGWDKRRS